METKDLAQTKFVSAIWMFFISLHFKRNYLDFKGKVNFKVEPVRIETMDEGWVER